MRAIRVGVVLYAAMAVGALACASEITYVPIAPDGGDDAAFPAVGGDASDTEDANDHADALVSDAPYDSGYVPDLTAQSAAYQINASHNGSTDDPSLFGTPTRRWEKDFTGPLAFPLIAHQKVIVTYVTPANRGVLQAFDPVSGASLWGPLDLGDSTVSSSAYDGGRVFALNRSGTLRAFDVDTGAPLWTIELGDPATPMQFLAPPTAYRGRVYVLPSDFGKAMAIDEMTGTIVWKAASPGAFESPAVTDTAVFVAVGCKDVYRLGLATGAVVWHATSGCGESSDTPVVADQTLYLASESGIAMLDITTGVWSTRELGGTRPPAIHAGLAFVTFNELVRGTSLSGNSVAWLYRPPDGTPFVRAPAMVAGGNVHVLWDDCTLRAFEPTTGAVVWSDSEPSACAGSPSLSPENAVAAMAAAAGIIAVPYRAHLVIYGVAATTDGGTDAGPD